MALIKLGALTQDVRGSLNGTTFSRNAGGAYVRSKVSPIQPVSDFSANSRQAFKEVSQAWAQSLTETERAGWISFAALHPFVNVFGDSITLSGIAFFQAANKRLAQLGFAFIADPPLDWDVSPPGAIDPILSVDGVGNVSLLINPANAPAVVTDIAYLFATPVLAPGAKPQNSQYRLVNSFDGDSPDETFDWGALYKARFADLVPEVGAKVAILYAYFDSTNGAISVASGMTLFATGVPGPLIAVASKQAVSAGGGNVIPWITTAVPHGLTTGQEVTVALSPPDALYDGAESVVTVISPTQITQTSRTGSASAIIATGGNIHRTL